MVKRSNFLVGILFGVLSLPACVGGTPDSNPSGDTPDAAITTPPEIDAASEPGADAGEIIAPLTVSGTVIDYFGTNIGNAAVVVNAELTTDGLDPAVMADADATGAYSMEILPASLFYTSVTVTGYRPSRNAVQQVEDEDLTSDLYVASNQGVARQYTGAGVKPIDGTGIVMIELNRNNGSPAAGVPVENISIATAGDPNTPVGTPLLVDPATTDLSSETLVSAEDANNKVRAGYLNLAPGDYILTVTVPPLNGNGEPAIQTSSVTILENGATFVLSNGETEDDGSANTIILDPEAQLGFTEDIYPILQSVEEGGDGCVGCHNDNHVLPFTGTPEATLALLNENAIDPADTPRINLEVPEESPFVTNPVFEPVPNHPNAFWTVNSNHYIGTVAWIVQGAALLRADAVLPEDDGN